MKTGKMGLPSSNHSGVVGGFGSSKRAHSARHGPSTASELSRKASGLSARRRPDTHSAAKRAGDVAMAHNVRAKAASSRPTAAEASRSHGGSGSLVMLPSYIDR